MTFVMERQPSLRPWMWQRVDNYGTQKTAKARAWFAARPRYHIHFTPTSASWIN